MAQKRFANEPLLYIHQPKMKAPEAPMQDHFYTAKKSNQVHSDENSGDTPTQKRKSANPMRRTYFRDLLQGSNELQRDEVHDVEDIKEEDNEIESRLKKQSFKDLTLIERIHYFLNVPDHILKMKCEIETADNKYRGIITDFKDNIVFMRTDNQVKTFVLYGDITGEVDELGRPIRLDWAQYYKGTKWIIYGHTPVLEPRKVNKTINIDTGCVFGNALTAFSLPEEKLTSVPSKQPFIEDRFR